MTDIVELITQFRRGGSAGTWRDLALCASHPDRSRWFPDDDDQVDVAKAVAVCRVCPVHGECLDFAVTTGQSDGIWGGTTPSERRRMVRLERRAGTG